MRCPKMVSFASPIVSVTWSGGGGGGGINVGNQRVEGLHGRLSSVDRILCQSLNLELRAQSGQLRWKLPSRGRQFSVGKMLRFRRGSHRDRAPRAVHDAGRLHGCLPKLPWKAMLGGPLRTLCFLIMLGAWNNPIVVTAKHHHPLL